MRTDPVIAVPVIAIPVIAIPVILAGLLLPFAPALGQVTMNGGALDSLSAPKPHRASPRPTPRRPAHRPEPPVHPPPSQATAPAAPAKPAKPAIPATPPAILALPPAVAVPLAHPPPPPTVPVADDAPGAASPIEHGLRVTFGTDRADLNPATVEALKQFALKLADQSTTSINVFAYAAGNPDDPSTPRRLSLERALAARAVLMQAGIASPRIYPRALGPAGGSEPDRVDVVTGTSTPPGAPSSAPSSVGHAG